MSDRREKLKRLGKKVLGGVKKAGIHVLKYGVPAYLTFAAGANVGAVMGMQKGFQIGERVGAQQAEDQLLAHGDARYREGAEDLAKDWTPKLQQGLQHIKQTYDDKELEWQRDKAARTIQYAFSKHKNRKLVKAYETRAAHQHEKYNQLQNQYNDVLEMNYALRDAAAAAEEAKSKPRIHTRIRDALHF